MIAAPAVVNPFPGLRPFEQEDSYLFFGRDRETDELLRRLDRSRFLAVLGSSGSGKSSLVRAGLLPSLDRGYMASAGSRWRRAVLRPGGNPIGSLATALAGIGPIDAAAMRAHLERSSVGLIHAVRAAALSAGENLLILVDQFEETFRFRAASGSTEAAAAFVKLLLTAAQQSDAPVYIVLTMRSDYLGECAQFRGLPEALNDAQYLVPRMTREELKEAIEGPTAVGGASITPRLVQQLLNDAGDSADHLPVLQHALMRSWEAARDSRQAGQPVDLPHYEAAGGIGQALNRHAEEVYSGLSEPQRQIARRLFQRITESGGGRDVRRPASLAEISAVTQAEARQVCEVIEAFRTGGNSFLLPKPGEPLNPDAVVDISHESLIRCWNRLQAWSREEAASAELYQRLARSAELYPDREALWRDPGLQLALDWKRTWQPNAAWASRYRGDFEIAMRFLEASRIPRDRVRALKRTAGWAAAITVPLLIVTWLLSGRVSSLVREGSSAAAQVARTNASTDPAGDVLRRLEALRLFTQRYHATASREWWNPFLKARESTLAKVANAYPGELDRLLVNDVRSSLVSTLRALPATPGPGDDLLNAYDSLRAYLMITSQPDKTENPFLPTLLLTLWSAGRNLSTDDAALARTQFDAFARLPRAPVRADGSVVEQARHYTRQFSPMERVYFSLLARANSRFPSTRLESNPAVESRAQVPGGFTPEGWDYMKDAAPKASTTDDGWVLGDQIGFQWSAAIQQQFKARFEKDCIGAWLTFLTFTRVTPFQTLKDAGAKLNQLASPASPLLHLFQIISRGTNVPGSVSDTFQPVHFVVPPSTGDVLVQPSNQAYMAALGDLQRAVANAADGSASSAAQARVSQAAQTVLIAAHQLAQAFRANPAIQVDAVVENLLTAPAAYVQVLNRGLGPAELNATAASLCAAMRPVLAKYPFSRGSDEASPAEVGQVFGKPDGKLWVAYNRTFKKLLPAAGGRFAPVASSGVSLSPEFVAFFNRAAAFSNTFYDDEGGLPQMRLDMTFENGTPPDAVWSFAISGAKASMTPFDVKSPLRIFWRLGAESLRGQLTVRAGTPVQWIAAKGPWAIFQLFDQADAIQTASGGVKLTWQVRNRAGRDLRIEAVGRDSEASIPTLTALVRGNSVEVLTPAFRSSFGCVAQAADNKKFAY